MARHRQPPRRSPGPAAPPRGLAEAVAHFRAGRPDEAARRCRALLAREPGQPDALHLLALAVHRTGDPAEALGLLREAAGARPGDPGIQLNLGNVAAAAGHLDEAERAFQKAAKARPGWAEPMNRLGVAMRLAGRANEAERAYRAALSADPGHVEARADLAVVLAETGRLDDAAEAASEAIRLRPGHFGAWNTLAVVRVEQDDREGAIDAYRKALAAAPEFAEGHFNLGLALISVGRVAEAVAALERALALKPDYPRAVAHLATQYQQACRWEPLPALHQKVREAVARGEAAVPPFALFSFDTTPEEQLACARVRAREVADRAERRFGAPEFPTKHRPDGPLTVGYLSADLRDHPVAHHLVGILEHHDRANVRPLVYAYGPGAGSPMRERIGAAAEGLADIGPLSALEAARRIHADGVDILVDLNGYTQNGRPDIQALKAAPVQAAYLGYPGTTGAPWVDYLIADRVTVPPDHQGAYAERLALLPPSYLLCDPRRVPAPERPDRAECGLPPEGPVLCCFNHAYKITPAVFGAWMRLLAAVPDAVLWLRAAPVAEDNLRAGAGEAGVDPARLIFAPRVDDPAEYLARLGVADLFLDTYPYNAHATAADALRAGVPVVTWSGETFASRVGQGLLAAVGLEALATNALADYEALALRLARTPEERAALRERLETNAATSRLFDPGRFVPDLEGLYAAMWARHAAGEAPALLDPHGGG